MSDRPALRSRLIEGSVGRSAGRIQEIGYVMDIEDAALRLRRAEMHVWYSNKREASLTKPMWQYSARPDGSILVVPRNV